jgi:hypothetical protein
MMSPVPRFPAPDPARRVALLAAAAAVLLGGTLSGCDEEDSITSVHNTDFAAEDSSTLSFAALARNTLRLEGVGGEMRIVGGEPGADIVVEVVRRVESESLADAEHSLLLLEVQHFAGPDEVVITTVQPAATGGRNFIVDYAVTLPRDLAVRLRQLNGSVEVAHVDGAVTVDLDNGSAALADLGGDADVDVANGSIAGQTALAPGARLALSVGNGSVALALSGSPSATFAAGVGVGEITLTGLTLADEVSTATSLTGILGGGEGAIELWAGIGNVVVTGASRLRDPVPRG